MLRITLSGSGQPPDRGLFAEKWFPCRSSPCAQVDGFDEAPSHLQTLFKSIAKAHHYFDLIRAGKTYAEIAASEGVSKHRIYKLVDLAFLAPDVVRDVFAGSQPMGLTTEWLLRHAIPELWDEQREAFRTL